jgi:hypothetical protein
MQFTFLNKKFKEKDVILYAFDLLVSIRAFRDRLLIIYITTFIDSKSFSCHSCYKHVL